MNFYFLTLVDSQNAYQGAAFVEAANLEHLAARCTKQRIRLPPSGGMTITQADGMVKFIPMRFRNRLLTNPELLELKQAMLQVEFQGKMQ